MAPSDTNSTTRIIAPLLLTLSWATGLSTVAAQSPAAGATKNAAVAQPPTPQERERALIERAIFQAYPEADAYRAIVGDVNRAARLQIEKRLPFKVHFDEVGKHRLIVAFRGRRPVGLVYRRNEEAEGGLSEIAWHISLDLRVVGFTFLRGRNRHIPTVSRSLFARALQGCNLGKIVKRIAEHERASKQPRDEGLASLERTVLRSAAKALVVTEVAWQREVEKLHDQATGFDLFPAAAKFTRRGGDVVLAQEDQRRTLQVKLLYAYDSGDTLLGAIAWSHANTGGTQQSLRWIIDRNMRTLDVTPLDNVRDVKLRKACSELKGRLLASPPSTTSDLGQLSRGLATIVHDKQRSRRGR